MLVKCLKEGKQKPMVGIFKRKYLIERIDHKVVGIAKRLKKIYFLLGLDSFLGGLQRQKECKST